MLERKWRTVGTGGGCTAEITEFLVKGRPSHALLTDGDANAPTEDCDDFVIGIYANDPADGIGESDQISCESFDTRAECLAWLEKEIERLNNEA